MISDVDISYNCEEILDEVGQDEIVRYCYENNLMTKEQAIEIIGDENKLNNNKSNCYISIDPNDVLDLVNHDNLYDYLCKNGYDFTKNEDSSYKDNYPTKENFIYTLKENFSKIFTKVYTKDDLKKELCEEIDFYLC